MIGSSEFRLAAECCRAAFAGSDPQEVDPREDIDWNSFLALVRFHRVEGLAWNALSRAQIVPSHVQHELRQAAVAIAARNLQAADECGSLLASFEAAKVPLLFAKGLTLGALAYGNPSLKSAVDIDILIDARDLARASELLERRGWRVDIPRGADPNRLQRWHRAWKESIWLRESPPLQMDLHTRLSDNRALIDAIDVHSPIQAVEFGRGIRLPTLARDELFAYLAVHGASSAWFRLKWISDFAGLINGRTGDELRQLYCRSQELGSARAAGQALLLADALFGSLSKAPELRQHLARDRATAWLFRSALRLVTRGTREPTEERLGTLPIRLSQFRLSPGLAFKWTELRGQLTRILSSRTT